MPHGSRREAMASADDLAPPSEPLRGELPIARVEPGTKWWRIHRAHHPPDGILYRSRHDPKHICAAIFNRPHCEFLLSTTTPLMDIPHHWAAILAAHGKGIA